MSRSPEIGPGQRGRRRGHGGVVESDCRPERRRYSVDMGASPSDDVGAIAGNVSRAKAAISVCALGRQCIRHGTCHAHRLCLLGVVYSSECYESHDTMTLALLMKLAPLRWPLVCLGPRVGKSCAWWLDKKEVAQSLAALLGRHWPDSPRKVTLFTPSLDHKVVRLACGPDTHTGTPCKTPPTLHPLGRHAQHLPM
jgi:hypothetical protein